MENDADFLPDLEIQKQVVQNAEKIFQKFKNYKPDHSEVDKFVTGTEKFEICEFYSGNLVLDIFELFHQGVTQTAQIDKEGFMSFIRKLFSMFSEKHKKLCALKIIDRWQLFDIDYSPYFAQISPDFNEKLNAALAGIGGDQFDEEMTENIYWSLVISPPHALHIILNSTIHSPAILPTILAIFHQIPELFGDRKLKIYHYPHEIQKTETLVEVVWRRVVRGAREEFTHVAQWANLRLVALELAANGVISPVSMLNLVLSELLSDYKTPKISIQILAQIGCNLLVQNEDFPWKFAVSSRQIPEDGLILTPTVLQGLLGISEESEDVRCLLKAIGSRMNEEFVEETRIKLMTSLKWSSEFAIATWFQKALKVEKRRVPKAILEKMTENDRFLAFESEETAWNSIIDLAIFDSECAVEILDLMTSSDEEDVVSHVERLILNGGPRELAEIIFKKFPIENSEELIQNMVEKIPKPSEEVIPTSESHVHIEITALDPPYQPRIVWPTHPVDPSRLVPMSRAEIEKNKKANESIKKRAAEWENGKLAELENELRQKWRLEGVFDAPKPSWMARYGNDLPHFDTGSTCGSVTQNAALNDTERTRINAFFDPMTSTSIRSTRRRQL